jgi:putative flippase GtrA
MVGCFNTGVDFAIYGVLANLVGVYPVVASVCSTGVALVVSFFLNSKFVFRSRRSRARTMPLFVGVSVFTGWGVQSVVIFLGVGVLGFLGVGVANLGAKVVAVGVGVLINYFAYRWIFGEEVESK